VASEKANSAFRYIVTQVQTHLQSNKISKRNRDINYLHVHEALEQQQPYFQTKLQFRQLTTQWLLKLEVATNLRCVHPPLCVAPKHSSLIKDAADTADLITSQNLCKRWNTLQQSQLQSINAYMRENECVCVKHLHESFVLRLLFVRVERNPKY
jgi:hypothetical protein